MTLPPPDLPPGAPADLLPGAVPPALFDLAVNRAAAALRGVQSEAAQARALAQWHARTRFARRVPLAEVARALALHPQQEGSWHWTGGLEGGWQAGKALFP
ncbi:hypothetical protein Deipr_0642 [Deinococcus proteolyticus MRP]|uniref:Uncharacterized protein n=1 Tax=Deinococcus proteolyticus (strain ATCC 35074 / DSM 20540 / JCM 6276 / NBRC 101906 / NCIMB 13154 / VKM Ac-1939 / CCM 2703 / MRP) TaxID=693977 RepID=F0RL30_DEIPM|nr:MULTISPECIES: hypothetical protein [Deinococcus]ADY25803.1 hypothetical protein Deipr_0642 [Deinococcus proteolyticus MRP]MCY1701926.1 hypothetical protein [Deinococcus sp. SL84]